MGRESVLAIFLWRRLLSTAPQFSWTFCLGHDAFLPGLLDYRNERISKVFHIGYTDLNEAWDQMAYDPV